MRFGSSRLNHEGATLFSQEDAQKTSSTSANQMQELKNRQRAPLSTPTGLSADRLLEGSDILVATGRTRFLQTLAVRGQCD
jgi:hypothetical protein